MSFIEGIQKFLQRIGVFGRLVIAFVPMLIIVMIGIGIGGDEEASLLIRIPVILVSLTIFSLLIQFINSKGE